MLRGAGVLVLLWLLSPAAGLCQEAPAAPSDDERKRQVDEAVREAEALAQDGRLAEALGRYERTYAEVPTRRLLWPMILLHVRLGRGAQRAIGYLDEYLRVYAADELPAGRTAEAALVRQLLADQQKRPAEQKQGPAEQMAPGRQDGGPAPACPAAPAAPDRPQVQVAAPPAARAPGLRVAKWVLGGIGLAGIAAGGLLWGLDGLQTCPQEPRCAQALDGKPAGIGLISAGAGLLAGSAVMFGIDYRSSRAERTAMLRLGGRY